MSIAITGSTGQLGRLVIRKLLEIKASQPVIALARNPDKAKDLGVSVRHADYSAPDTWPAALDGVQTLLLISSSELGSRTQQHGTVIEAAQAASVKRIVYTSLLHAPTSPLSLAQEHRETEAALQASGLSITILRNGWYIENHTGQLQAALQHGFIGSAGQGKFSSAARADLAEAAALVLTGDGHEDRIYELAGDQPYTLSEFAAEVSRQLGNDFIYQNIPEQAYAEALKQAGLPPAIAEALASWDVGAATGALFDDAGALTALLGRPTTSLSTVVKHALEGLQK